MSEADDKKAAEAKAKAEADAKAKADAEAKAKKAAAAESAEQDYEVLHGEHHVLVKQDGEKVRKTLVAGDVVKLSKKEAARVDPSGTALKLKK